MNILSDKQYDKLYLLYDLRNKVVHRYIITDLKTRRLREIGYDYEVLCEEIRLVLAGIETEQFEKKIGYHGLKDPHRERNSDHVNQLFSMVNDKHFYKEFYREV